MVVKQLVADDIDELKRIVTQGQDAELFVRSRQRARWQRVARCFPRPPTWKAVCGWKFGAGIAELSEVRHTPFCNGCAKGTAEPEELTGPENEESAKSAGSDPSVTG